MSKSFMPYLIPYPGKAEVYTILYGLFSLIVEVIIEVIS